jgi:hypothetical protein
VPIRPSKLWKDLSPDRRVALATAFWQDDQGPDQHIEAIVMLARRLNFRTKSVQALPIDRRAKHLAQLKDVSDALATRALIAYHFQSQRPMMAAFLDAVGIAHEDGLITADEIKPPDRAALVNGVERIRTEFPAEQVDLYIRTLSAIDPDTWGALETVAQLTADETRKPVIE